MSARIRFRPRITKKNMFFFCTARALNCCRFSKKTRFILVDKKNIPKKKSLFQEMKHFFSSYVFIACFFSSPSLPLFKKGHCFIYFVALINFSRNLSKVFFIWSPSLTFRKIGGMFIFLNVFLTPSLIRFWIFSDLKQI